MGLEFYRAETQGKIDYSERYCSGLWSANRKYLQ